MTTLLQKINNSHLESQRLGDLLSAVIDKRGITPKKLGSDWVPTGTPVISAKNIKNHSIVNREQIRFIDEKTYKKWMPNPTKAGDIILTSEAPMGELYVIKDGESFCLGQRLFGLRTNPEKLNSSYLFHFLQSSQGQHELNRRISGTAAEGIRQAELINIEIKTPDLLTQKKVSEILTAYDEKIGNNNVIIKNIETLAQTIFDEWFVKFHFPGHEKMKFVESEMGDILEGWEVKSVLDVIKRIGVGRKYDNKSALPSGKIPILDQGSSGFIGYHNEEPGVMASLDKPIVVFTNHTCYYRLLTEPFSCIQNVLPYVGTGGYDTYFVYFLTKEKIKMQEYKGHWPEFEQQMFVIPPVALANKFADKAKVLVAKMVECEKENALLKASRDRLLAELI